jgi:hypothetical protein
MSIRIKLTNPTQEIMTAGYSALAQDINKSISQNIGKIVVKIKEAIGYSISLHPTVIALSDYAPGGLASELGLYPGQGSLAASQIVNIITEDVTFRFSKISTKLQGSIQFYIAHEAVSRLVALPIGHVIYGRGDLHWLKWLLERGDAIIIDSYEYNPQSGFGRSGGGSMALGGSWRVPPEYAGTPDDNFISDSLFNKPFQDTLQNIIERYL